MAKRRPNSKPRHDDKKRERSPSYQRRPLSAPGAEAAEGLDQEEVENRNSNNSDAGKQQTKTSYWKDVDQFWFGYGSATALGVFRILGTLAILLDLILLSFDFDSWFSERGFVPLSIGNMANGALDRNYTFFGFPHILPFTVPRLNVLADVVDTRVTLALWILCIVFAVTTLIGYKTRLSSIGLAILFVSFHHRNILILHGGDTVMRISCLYIALAPSGAACSLDRLLSLWRGQASGQAVQVSLWPQRIIQYNVALIYFTTWWLKMDGTRWRNGTATYFTSRLNEFHRFPVPHFLQSAFLSPLFTYGALLTELSLGTLIFYRPLRKYVLTAGLLLHGYIEYSMNIPMFAFAICSMYICFFDGEEISDWAKRVGERFKAWRLTMILPADGHLRPGPGLMFEAMDPFGLVSYEKGTDKSLSARDATGKQTNPVGSSLRRLPGSYLFAVVPGLWERILASAIVASDGDSVGNGAVKEPAKAI